jgi:hypothetical protein
MAHASLKQNGCKLLLKLAVQHQLSIQLGHSYKEIMPLNK